MRITHVGPRHRICREDADQDKSLPLPPSGFRLLKTCGEADGAVLAWEHGRIEGWFIVGFFRYFLDKGNYLGASGTWVHPVFRRKGLALRLWDEALRKHLPYKVGVRTISKGGRRLVATLKKKYPAIKFGPLSR